MGLTHYVVVCTVSMSMERERVEYNSDSEFRGPP